jgi:hypothetical protein
MLIVIGPPCRALLFSGAAEEITRNAGRCLAAAAPLKDKMEKTARCL